jgi:thioredoxin reductase (NADPH)
MGHEPIFAGERELTGRGVSYCASCDGPFFLDRDVLVVGENEEALDEIGRISAFAKRVYVVTHGKDLEAGFRKLSQGCRNVEILSGWRIGEIQGKQEVEGAVLRDADGNVRNLDVSGVFIYAPGKRPMVDFLAGAVATTPEGYLRVDDMDMSTSVEGVFAAGDVTGHAVRQAVVSAAEGCIAALSAEKHLRGTGRLKSQWH